MSFPLSIPVPAIRGHFGRDSLLTFQTQVLPEQVESLLGHDPRYENWKRLAPDLRQIYEKVQRKTTRSRRESVEGYLEDRLLTFQSPGAFPAICIGMTNPPTFVEGDKIPDVGQLLLEAGPQNIRIVLDGLGRVAGSLAFLEANANRDDATDLFTLPTTIFAPHPRHGKLTLIELGQLFFDFNFRATKISPAQALQLDQSDPHLSLTNQLGKRDVITKHGGMETGRQSLGSKSTSLVVQAILLRFVRGACEGAKFQKSNKETVENPNLNRESLPTIRENLELFLEALAEGMGSERFQDQKSLHLSSVGWQALGLVAHDLFILSPNLDSVDRTRVITEISRMDWSRSNRDMVEIGVLSEVAGEIGMSGRGVAAVLALHKYIREQTRLGKVLPKEVTQQAVA